MSDDDKDEPKAPAEASKPKRKLNIDPEGGALGFFGGSMIALAMFVVLLAVGIGIVAAIVFSLRCAWEAGG